MSFLDRIKNFMGVGTPKVGANYAAYRRQRLVEGGVWGEPFWRNHTQSISRELTVGEWRTVNSAARKLYWNTGVVNAAIDQKSMLTVGMAMRPIFTGADREWGKQAEAVLLDWMRGLPASAPGAKQQLGARSARDTLARSHTHTLTR